MTARSSTKRGNRRKSVPQLNVCCEASRKGVRCNLIRRHSGDHRGYTVTGERVGWKAEPETWQKG